MAGSSEQPGANRLLIVEDDAAERRVLAAMFQGEGFDVTACGSASEAFEQLARRRFAAAVVDLRLPDLAEQEFLERLSTVARDVPLVIYTAYGSYEAAKEAINCGARAFVEKAGDPEELIRRVHQAVRTCLEQRARLLEQAVAERTRELEEANRALRREVEERQRVEDELRLRDHAVEVSSEGISITDARQPDHPVIYVNRGFQRITGYSAAEIVGKKLPLLKGPETDSAAAQKLRDAMRRGHECCVELLNYRKDGTPFWNRVSITPVRDKEGDLTHFIGVHHDVTEAKQGDRFRRLTQFSVDKSADAALWIAADGRILYGNQSACRLVGVSLNQLLQLKIWDIDRHHSPSQWQAFLERIRQEKAETTESAFRTASGTPVPVELSANHVQFERREYVCIFARDLSERKRAEEALRQREAELAHMARLATLWELTGGLAHEINQPLYAISNYGQGAARRLRDGTMDRDGLIRVMEQIAGEAHRASRIIARLRQLVSKRSPRRSTTQLNRLIRDCLALLQPELDRHQITVQLDLDDALPPVLADSVQIEQVILNLIRNAAEALQNVARGRRLIEIATRLDPDGAVGVVVADTGPGLAEANPERLFDAFYTTKDDGLGMGLAISRTIIQSHGGRIWFSTDQPEGISFHFTLPLETEGARDGSPSDRVHRG